jgi:ABC-type multidrug transport system ATPase subunit
MFALFFFKNIAKDSVNAFRVMQCLHTLANDRGKTIIFAIHAPDSALFGLFSNVVILAKG